MIKLLCGPLAHSFGSPASWAQCSTLLSAMSSKSPGLITTRAGCLNLNVAKVLQTQRMCKAVSDACSGLFTSPNCNRRPCKWQCAVSNPVNMLAGACSGLFTSPNCNMLRTVYRPQLQQTSLQMTVCCQQPCQYASWCLLRTVYQPQLQQTSLQMTVCCQQPCQYASCCLLRFSNSPAFFCAAFFKKAAPLPLSI